MWTALTSHWLRIAVREHFDEATRKTEPNEKTQSAANRQVTTLSILARLKRTGEEMRIIVSDGSEPATPDTGLTAPSASEEYFLDRQLRSFGRASK
jgi:hypothetical protein